MQRPIPRLDLLAVILFLSLSVRWSVKHRRTQKWDAWQHWQSRGCILQTCPQCREERHHHNLEVCYQASGKQLGFYQIKCWDCFGRAYKDCQEQRWSLLLQIFPHTNYWKPQWIQHQPILGYKGHMMPVRSPLQDQNTAARKEHSFTAQKNLYSKHEFPQEPSCTMLSHIHSKAISSCTCTGRKSAWGFLLHLRRLG